MGDDINQHANLQVQIYDCIPLTTVAQHGSHYQLSEHVIAFWVEGNETKWYLGVVEKVLNYVPQVSYMVCTDSRGKSWTYLENAEILATSPEQFLATKVKLQYLGSVCICCATVADELIEEMSSTV